MRSPSGAVVAIGAGALVAVAGLGVPAAVAVAGAAWVLRVGVGALWRSPGPPAPDPFAVGEPWRRYVTSAMRYQRRFEEGCASLPPGPLRERLETLSPRVDDATREIWDIARRGNQISRTRRTLDTPAPPQPDPDLPETVDARFAHRDAANRIDAVVTATKERLTTLDAQLGAVVARVLEVVATAGAAGELGGVEGDLSHLLDDMEALRLALGEIEDTGGSTR